MLINRQSGTADPVLFSRRELRYWNRQMSGTCWKDFWDCLVMKRCVIFWLHLSYSISFFSYEDSRKQKRTLLILNQQLKKISKWNTPLTNCMPPKYRNSNKKLPERTWIRVVWSISGLVRLKYTEHSTSKNVGNICTNWARLSSE